MVTKATGKEVMEVGYIKLRGNKRSMTETIDMTKYTGK